MNKIIGIILGIILIHTGTTLAKSTGNIGYVIPFHLLAFSIACIIGSGETLK